MISLGSFTGGRELEVCTPSLSSRKSSEQTTSELKTLFLWLTVCTDLNQQLNLSNVHVHSTINILGEAKE